MPQYCTAHLAAHVLTEPGRYRLFPTIANGQPATVPYRRPPRPTVHRISAIWPTSEGDQ
jgi:RNA polymerase sigma-70 factor (ECF subfamily)